MTSDANSFLSVLGKGDEDEDDVPRRRKKTPPPQEAPAASTEPARYRVPEPVHKTSVDLLFTLKRGLQELCDRDRRGPKAELNEALRNHLLAKGIDVKTWEG